MKSRLTEVLGPGGRLTVMERQLLNRFHGDATVVGDETTSRPVSLSDDDVVKWERQCGIVVQRW